MLGLLIGCSGGSSEPAGMVVVVAPDQDDNSGATTDDSDTEKEAVTQSDPANPDGTDANVPEPVPGTSSSDELADDSTAFTLTLEPNEPGTSETDTDTDTGTTDGPTDEPGDIDDNGSTDDGTTGPDTTPYPVGSLAYLLNNQADLSIAFAALQAADLDRAINESSNEFTLFLPTNDAFDALASQSEFELDTHIASGTVSSDVLVDFSGRELEMSNGRRLTLGGESTQSLTIEDAALIRVDIVGDTGTSIAHVIDTVIGEETISNPYPEGSLADALFQRGDMTNALEALQEAGLDVGLDVPRNQWTLFLPDDSAFDDQDNFDVLGHINQNVSFRSDFLEGLVSTSMGMTSGDVFMFGGGGTESLTIGDATIDEPDVQPIPNRGPVVHIIDRILVPQ